MSLSLESLLPALTAVAIMLLIGFPVHEFSHALAASRLGDQTARYMGRLTLNPAVHLDPLGAGILALSAFIGGIFIGWAKPTPVNPMNLQGGRRGEAIVAAAGPISNLLMAMVVAIPLRVIFANPELEFDLTAVAATRFLLGVATFFVVINVFLFVFNLLPIPPLDGWKVLLGVVDARTSYTLRRYEQYGILLLLALLLVGGRIIGPIGQGIVRFLLGA